MKETNNVIYSNERSTHIYDDVVDLQQNNDVIHRTMRKSVTARISHHYERLIGIARTKENRMCVFGIVSTVIAIVSLTVAVVFSVLYAKTQHCKNATNDNWSMVCSHSKDDVSFIMCPLSTQSIIIRQVEVMRYTDTGQQDTPPCFFDVICVTSDYNITENMNAICRRKNACRFDYNYYRQLPGKDCELGYTMFNIYFSCQELNNENDN